MKLTAEQLKENYTKLIGYIEKYIQSPRKEKLIKFYKKYEDRLIIMPASHKKEYHNSFPGGYVDHVIRVTEAALKINQIWVDLGVCENYTLEEIIFSALNHDLGKMGDEQEEAYIPQTDNWRRERLGENYMFNKKLPFMTVSDRGLYLLQTHGINYSLNEYLAIKLHDGIYDESNKPYLNSFFPEQKPRTSIMYIIHQADLLAARIEFEKEWLSEFKDDKENIKKKKILNKEPKQSIQTKALKSIESKGLTNLLDTLIEED